MSASSSRIEQLFTDRFSQSAELFQRAKGLFPSGVTHDSRHLKPFPVYADQASGSRKVSVEGHDIIDYWVGHGALLLGHSHPAVVEAVQAQVAKSTHPGSCHQLELEWGERVKNLIPSAEMLRFTSSGTEATLMALRIARIATGRNKVIKFAGHFHGWHDSLINSSAPPHDGDPQDPGITDGVYDDIIIIPPNDPAALESAIDEHHPACVIHEGNGARWGVAPTQPEFLQSVREITKRKDIVFILDEVITGFRVDKGGFQSVCDVVPDMTTMAKVLAGGLPGGCLAGRADLLQVLAFDNPLGRKMKHPGTYNANPLSASAGVAALDLVATGDPSRQASEAAAAVRTALNQVFADKSARMIAYGDFSAIKIHPDYDGPRSTSPDFIPFDRDWRQLDRSFDKPLGHAFRCALLLGGVDWMGWAGSTSLAHDDRDVDQTATAFAQAIDLLREDDFDI
ncbi:MAG: aspartate aminotransferase family protein [Planctomycetota bacterium]|jgi:glutamate-1-semialdehyde 2,1-aminomutase